MRNVRVIVVGLIAPVVVLAGCADDGEGAVGVYRTNGCSACHGADLGGGALGPPLTWQEGDTVELTDGSTVEVDAAYVERAIVDPSVEIVAGWEDTMTAVSLTDAEVALLVDYLLGRP